MCIHPCIHLSPKIAPMRPMIIATSSSDLVQATAVMAAMRVTMQPDTDRHGTSINGRQGGALMGECGQDENGGLAYHTSTLKQGNSCCTIYHTRYLYFVKKYVNLLSLEKKPYGWVCRNMSLAFRGVKKQKQTNIVLCI